MPRELESADRRSGGVIVGSPHEEPYSCMMANAADGNEDLHPFDPEIEGFALYLQKEGVQPEHVEEFTSLIRLIKKREFATVTRRQLVAAAKDVMEQGLAPRDLRERIEQAFSADAAYQITETYTDTALEVLDGLKNLPPRRYGS